MRILLIGHRGYLGAGLHAYLRRSGNEVVGWDKEEDLFKLEPSTLSREKIDAVVNLAVMADRASANFQIDTLADKVTLEGTRHLARVLRGTRLPWIQMSTREVFGPLYSLKDVTKTPKGYRPKFLIDETRGYNPQNAYGKSKLMAEFVSESHPFSSVIRLTTCYTDAYAPTGNWVVNIANALAAGKPVTLTRKGWQFRDPMHIDDLGSLIELVFQKGIAGEKIHAGGGEKNLISLLEFVKAVDPKAEIRDMEGGDYGFAFDNAKAFRLTGWKPKILFREKIPLLAANAKRGLAEKVPA